MKMRFVRAYAVAVISAALLMGTLPAVGAAGSPPQEGNPKAHMLFFVSQWETGKASILPIAVLEGGKLKDPGFDGTDNGIEGIARTYYARGRKYRVLSGGGEAGSVTVNKWNKGEECFGDTAEVTLRTSTRLNRNVHALATDSASLGQGKSTRRPPTPAERAAVMPLVQAAYKQRGVPAALLPSMVTVNLTAIDMDKDGRSELVGSFVVKKQKGGAARYALFMVAEPEGASYRTTVLQFAKFTEDDLMSGSTIEAIENGVYMERLLDGLDVDGDGASELFTVTDGLEGDTYIAYKKQAGKWEKVYEFGHYRCAF